MAFTQHYIGSKKLYEADCFHNSNVISNASCIEISDARFSDLLSYFNCKFNVLCKWPLYMYPAVKHEDIYLCPHLLIIFGGNSIQGNKLSTTMHNIKVAKPVIKRTCPIYNVTVTIDDRISIFTVKKILLF